MNEKLGMLKGDSQTFSTRNNVTDNQYGNLTQGSHCGGYYIYSVTGCNAA
jgi:hypothetical protein